MVAFEPKAFASKLSAGFFSFVLTGFGNYLKVVTVILKQWLHSVKEFAYIVNATENGTSFNNHKRNWRWSLSSAFIIGLSKCAFVISNKIK